MNTDKTSLKTRLLTALPAVLLMALIFSFSAKTATESSATSDPIAKALLNLYTSITGTVVFDEDIEWLSFFSHLVRKTAHFCEYALLGALTAFHFYSVKFRKLRLFIVTTLVCAAYAASDEIHQYFVEGRSCQFSDMCLDTAGAATGTLLFILAAALIIRYKASSK